MGVNPKPPNVLQRGALFARTLAHLHPAQLLLRPVHIARNELLHRSPPLAALVAGHPDVRDARPVLAFGGALPPDLPGLAPERRRVRDALNGFEHLVGVDVPLTPPTTEFHLPHPKLIPYQQAYLGVARSLATVARVQGSPKSERAAALAIAHMREFVERVPPGEGIAWDPYPVAMRLMNLIVARELLLPIASPDDAIFLNGPLLQSLGQHARWMTASLELHLLGNHLFTDGAALFVAGCALDAPGALRWRALGRTILERSLATDVLPDGGHGERSPMYAAIYLDQLLLVLSAARRVGETLAGASAAAVALGRYLLEITHPDGQLPLLGDSAFDEAPEPIDLAGAVGLAHPSLRNALYGGVAATEAHPNGHVPGNFPETSILALRDADSLLVVDGGPLGTFDQPGHAHADALSFELSHRGARIVTDGGAGLYEDDARRAYFRGPRAHSSVSVNGNGSDEVWSVWRAGRRAEIEPLIHTSLDGIHVVRGEVTAPWGWHQERLLIYAPGLFLSAVDRITAPENVTVASHLHLSPELSVRPEEEIAHLSDGLVWKKLLGGKWTMHKGEIEPWRGYTSWRMGAFTPSPEIELEAVRVGPAWCAAWVLLLDPTASAETTGSVVRLQTLAAEITVACDRDLRWELRRQ